MSDIKDSAKKKGTEIRVNLYLDKYVHPELYADLLSMSSKSRAERIRLLASLALSGSYGRSQSGSRTIVEEPDSNDGLVPKKQDSGSADKSKGPEKPVANLPSDNKKAPGNLRRGFSSKARI